MMRFLLAIVFLARSACAASGPENAVVFVNGDSWASMAIANEYRALRGLSSNHLVVLHDLPSFEEVNVDTFREKILLPGLKEVERRGLANQLDYVLYSADFPTAVDVSADMAGKKFPQQITQPASLTGLTFLYKFTLAKNPAYLGLNTNFYFRQIAKTAGGGPLPEADQARYVKALSQFSEISRRIESARKAGDADAKFTPEEIDALRDTRKTFEELKGAHPGNTEILFNLACAEARLGDGEAAIATLRQAMEHGWFDMRHAQQDPDLRAIHGSAGFKELADRARDAKFELSPTSGFRGSVGWMPSGQPVPPAQGVRYLISTMLACTSGRGNSVDEALAYLSRSARADATRPPGTIYYLENTDVRSNTREWGFRRAVEKLESIGIAARVENGVLPMNKQDVAGMMAGAADFSWKASGSTILPGAICEHLTSCGGMMREGDPQTPLTEFLRHGAAGASGTVREPYAIQAKFPNPFLHFHYAQGCTLGEAFYQSIAGPYQLLIVGDALCAPWKKRIVVTLPAAGAEMTFRGKAALQPSVASPDNVAISHLELFVDGKRAAIAKSGQPLEFDTTALPDGFHELQIVANGNDPLGSTGRMTLPCVIRNGTTDLAVDASIPAEAQWDRALEWKARAESAKQIVFHHAGREIAKIDGAEGAVKIDPRILGQGPVEVQPIAKFGDGSEHYGKPLRFRVVPPAPLPAQTLPAGKTLANGFHVKSGPDAPFVVQKAEGDWLAKAEVKPDARFSVEGWFNVEQDGVYQFQLRGPAELALSIDGSAQTWPRGKEWWHVPVSLAKGLHRVRIEGKAEGAPQLDARFGPPGTHRLAGERFQHLK